MNYHKAIKRLYCPQHLKSLELVDPDHYRANMRKLMNYIVFLAILSASPAHSHPHVWVTGTASFQMEQAKLAQVGMRWQFDAFFSQVLGADFDTNADGVFDESETQAMQIQVFTSLKDYGYFTHLRSETSDAERSFERVDNFSVKNDNGELVFSFDLVLAEPIDPTSGAIGLSVYDPTIYVDLILEGDNPVALAGADGLGCALEYRQGNEIENQSTFFVPQEVWLNCSGS